MDEATVALRAAAVLTLLALTGLAVARVGGRRVDLFAATWWGLAVLSLAGVVLARARSFSLVTLGLAAGGVAGAAVVASLWRPRPLAGPRPGRAVPLVAGLAGILTCAWTWPPFETFMASADSTMYVDAGVHLARTGSYEVADTVARLLPPPLAKALFPSVSIFERGPYIRLPGGLLMASRDAASAMPAFFPLVSMWSGVLAAIGGPALAPAVAPLGMGLAVWALTLFAGEAFGLAVAVPTALVFLGNFAVWWFGRFPMSEPLTIAFVWGGLVFLGRGAPFAAGMMLGLAGVARAETIVFVGAAVAWWAAWTPVRARELAPLAAGVALAGTLAAVGLVASPNHQLAYLWNDLAFAWTRVVFRVLPALDDGRLVAALALVPLGPLLVGVAVAWRGGAAWRTVIRVALAFGIVVGAVLYLRLGGRAEPIRHLGWIVTSMSPLGLALALVGGVVAWSRGGPAARLALIMVVLVAAFFVPSPRISSYQPWAMRRFLPVVLPGLALAAGVALGGLFRSERRGLGALAVALTALVVGLEIRPILTVRHADYFAGSLAGTRRLAERIPADAIVVVDGAYADLQVQVPLWLVFGRESVMAMGGGSAWRDLLATLVATGRPIYWIQNRMGPPPTARGLVFTVHTSDDDLTVQVPDAPIDSPPAAVIRKLVPLGVYGVTAGAGLGELSSFRASGDRSLGSICMRATQSSGLAIKRPSCTVEVAPLASLPFAVASSSPSLV